MAARRSASPLPQEAPNGRVLRFKIRPGDEQYKAFGMTGFKAEPPLAAC